MEGKARGELRPWSGANAGQSSLLAERDEWCSPGSLYLDREKVGKRGGSRLIILI